MDDIDIVRLSVPGTLVYRDVVLRVVASFCRLARDDGPSKTETKQDPSRAKGSSISGEHSTSASDDDFDDKVVSAVGEAFNNVAIHGYRGRRPGNVELELAQLPDSIRVRLFDTGIGFDLEAELDKPPASLPESRMGLFIIRSCMDTIAYKRGRPPEEPNVLTLTKRYAQPVRQAAVR
jgi:serine/threonine-protein kinase RsbW